MANPNPQTPWISGGADDPDPNAREYTVTAPDGRTIGVAEYGPEDGTPVFSIHGTPGSRYGGPPPEKPDLAAEEALARHPMLVAIKLWACAHLLANGSSADVLLFGSFLVWAVVDRISLKQRAPRARPGVQPSKWNDAIVLAVGLLLYAWFGHWAHLRLFGVAPLA